MNLRNDDEDEDEREDVEVEEEEELEEPEVSCHTSTIVACKYIVGMRPFLQ